MQTIRFGMSLDGQSGWHLKPSIGESTLGPSGLLGLLEMQLGLTRRLAAASTRVIQYRACLASCRTGTRFYERSFAVDELGTAARLLSWRDSWYLQGWTGQFPEGAPRRLHDLAAVEVKAAACVAPGPGQRLADVCTAMAVTRPQIESIHLTDPWEDYPARWQQVLRQLPVTDASPLTAEAAATTLLGALQRLLLATEEKPVAPLPWKPDGSLRLYRAETGLAATQYLAAAVTAADTDHALVLSSPSALTDGTLEAFDRPRLGVAPHSALRPALQLLPLAMQLLWEPLDYRSLLQYLSHPIHPLPGKIRYPLAAELANTPGIGGPAWQATVSRIEAKLGAGTGSLREDIARWIEHPRHPPETGAPLTAVHEHANALADFFRRDSQD